PDQAGGGARRSRQWDFSKGGIGGNGGIGARGAGGPRGGGRRPAGGEWSCGAAAWGGPPGGWEARGDSAGRGIALPARVCARRRASSRPKAQFGARNANARRQRAARPNARTRRGPQTSQTTYRHTSVGTAGEL